MYAYIKGTIVQIAEGYVVMDNHGMGYRVFTPASVSAQLCVGEEAKLFTHFAVREDAMQLYGFLSEQDVQLYRMLLAVGGIGPKGAIGILSVMDADDLRFAILSEDAAAIAKAPGVGKKTAQKVIIELKDKLDLQEAFEEKAAHTKDAAGNVSDSIQSEAVMALAALGYTNAEAMKAVRKVLASQNAEDVESLIKAALKELF